jgi:Ras-related protein Rab-1A
MSTATATPNLRLVRKDAAAATRSMDHDLTVKAIIVGDSGVGKSSLLYRYTDNEWNPFYIATIGVDFKTMSFERDGKLVRMQLWDTAGQDRFQTITRTFYRGVHGAMVVFDVCDAESFENVGNWMKEVTTYAAQAIPLLLVGNKADMAATHRQVPVERAQALAESMGCVYVETSAKEDARVAEAFAKLTEACIESRVQSLNALKTSNDTIRRRQAEVDLTRFRNGVDPAKPTGTCASC